MDCWKRNDICPDSSVCILLTLFKEGAEVELWGHEEVPLHSGNREGTPPPPPSHHHSHAVCKKVEEKSAVLDDISIWFSFLRTH